MRLLKVIEQREKCTLEGNDWVMLDAMDQIEEENMGGRSISPIANELLEIVLKSLGLSEVVKICIKCASTDHLVENCSKYWTDRQSKVRHRRINCIIRKEIGINHPASAAYCPLRRDWIHHLVIGKRKSVQP